jgi:DNA-binding NarL/FixJ family response regulator
VPGADRHRRDGRKRSGETVTTLTAQEALIARLARDGRTNPQIGGQLFLSGRTIEWHLRKIITKLGISSRCELNAALAQAAYELRQPDGSPRRGPAPTRNAEVMAASQAGA